MLIIAGAMFYNSGGHRPQTASNNTPTATQTNPSAWTGPRRDADYDPADQDQ
jgi:hypothetical protein